MKKLYLTEIQMGEKLEPVGIFSSFDRCKDVIGKNVGLITELVVNDLYRDGIGAANHWHINDPEAERNR